jgi:hypothetical protein
MFTPTNDPTTGDLIMVDTGAVDSSSISSGSSSGGFDFAGLFTSLAGDATSIIKQTSSPTAITAVKPGQYLNAQGQLVTVPASSSNYTTLILVGIGLVLAYLIIKRFA